MMIYKLIPIAVAAILSSPVIAQVDNVTLTGSAVQLGSTFSEPFTVSFTIDTASGIQTYQSCGDVLCGFAANGVNITGLTAVVGGLSQPIDPSPNNAYGSGPPGTMFAGVQTGGLTWDFDMPAAGLQPTLNSIISSAPPSNQSGMDGWLLNVTSVNVAQPVSVPTPGIFGMLLFGLAIAGALAFSGRDS